LLEHLIESFGLWAVLIGTLLEGETVLILGAIAAHRGYLPLGAVMGVAALGALAADQAIFHLGRWRGAAWLESRPRWAPRVAKCQRLMEKRGRLLVVLFRFLYGLRTVLPFLWGARGMPAIEFLAFDLIGIGAWVLAVGVAGFAFGAAAEALIEDVERWEGVFFAVVALAGLATWILVRIRHRRPAGSQP